MSWKGTAVKRHTPHTIMKSSFVKKGSAGSAAGAQQLHHLLQGDGQSCCVEARGAPSATVQLDCNSCYAGLGTRPGLQGEALVSSGLADFDDVLGGGIPLGSLVLILEDAWTPHGSTLLRYFLAEGAVCGHTVHWAAASKPSPSALPQVAKGRSRSSRKVRYSVQQAEPLRSPPQLPRC